MSWAWALAANAPASSWRTPIHSTRSSRRIASVTGLSASPTTPQTWRDAVLGQGLDQELATVRHLGRLLPRGVRFGRSGRAADILFLRAWTRSGTPTLSPRPTERGKPAVANIKSQIKRNRQSRRCSRAQQGREVRAEDRRPQVPRGRRGRRRRRGQGRRRDAADSSSTRPPPRASSTRTRPPTASPRSTRRPPRSEGPALAAPGAAPLGGGAFVRLRARSARGRARTTSRTIFSSAYAASLAWPLTSASARATERMARPTPSASQPCDWRRSTSIFHGGTPTSRTRSLLRIPRGAEMNLARLRRPVGHRAGHQHRRGAAVQRPAQLLQRLGGLAVEGVVGDGEGLGLGPAAEVASGPSRWSAAGPRSRWRAGWRRPTATAGPGRPPGPGSRRRRGRCGRRGRAAR